MVGNGTKESAPMMGMLQSPDEDMCGVLPTCPSSPWASTFFGALDPRDVLLASIGHVCHPGTSAILRFDDGVFDAHKEQIYCIYYTPNSNDAPKSYKSLNNGE